MGGTCPPPASRGCEGGLGSSEDTKHTLFLCPVQCVCEQPMEDCSPLPLPCLCHPTHRGEVVRSGCWARWASCVTTVCVSVGGRNSPAQSQSPLHTGPQELLVHSQQSPARAKTAKPKGDTTQIRGWFTWSQNINMKAKKNERVAKAIQMLSSWGGVEGRARDQSVLPTPISPNRSVANCTISQITGRKVSGGGCHCFASAPGAVISELFWDGLSRSQVVVSPGSSEWCSGMEQKVLPACRP